MHETCMTELEKYEISMVGGVRPPHPTPEFLGGLRPPKPPLKSVKLAASGGQFHLRSSGLVYDVWDLSKKTGTKTSRSLTTT